MAASRQRAARDGLYDANPGGTNTSLQLRAYGEVSDLIYDELRDAPVDDGHARRCGRCEKCRRVVGMLEALGGNPRACGYARKDVEAWPTWSTSS